jgi:hypothetical protein
MKPETLGINYVQEEKGKPERKREIYKKKDKYTERRKIRSCENFKKRRQGKNQHGMRGREMFRQKFASLICWRVN